MFGRLPGVGWVLGKILAAGADITMAPLKAAAGAVAAAVGSMLATLATLWIRLDVPDVWTGSTSPFVQAIQAEVAPLVALLAVLGIILGAGRLAWERHAQPGFDLVHGLLVLVLVTGAGVPVVGLLTSGADAWAQSMLDGIGGGDFGRNLLLLVSPSGPLAPVLVIFFGTTALLFSVVQIALLAFRAATLVLMAGLLPVSASLTMTAAGRQQFRRVVAWLIALAAYKPFAALIYVTAFQLAGTPGIASTGGIATVLIGLTMMLMALLALPALLRLLVPAINAINATPGTGGGGPLPQGARVVKGVSRVIS